MASFGESGYWAWKYNPTKIKERLAVVKREIKNIQKTGLLYDALCVMGTSGSWLAPLLILEGHDTILVRKSGERSHGQSIEGRGDTDPKRVVVVDDFMDSGDTIRQIREKLKRRLKRRNTEVVGIILHDDDACKKDSFEGIPIFGKR